MLYVVVFATYIFYVANLWEEFYEGGILIGSLLGAVLVGHSVIGIYAVRDM